MKPPFGVRGVCARFGVRGRYGEAGGARRASEAICGSPSRGVRGRRALDSEASSSPRLPWLCKLRAWAAVAAACAAGAAPRAKVASWMCTVMPACGKGS
eukprot:1464886-Prymnesium_polylepis.2